MIWLAACAALAVGYALGRLRALPRAFDRLYALATAETRSHTPRRAVAEAASLVLLIAAFAVRPRVTARRIRDARKPELRESAPELDANWGRR